MNRMITRVPGKSRNTAMLGAAALVLLAIVGLSYREWRRYHRSNSQAAQSRDISETSSRLVSGLIDAETGQRGFLLTGEDRYLEPYNQAIQAIPTDLNRLNDLLAARPGESANVARFNDLTSRKLTELRQTIELRRTQGAAAAVALVFSDQGKRTMDDIRASPRRFSAGTAPRKAKVP